MMKSGRREPLTASTIKYDFSYSVNRKTIIFPPLSREKISFISYAAKYLVLMEKFLMWQKTFSPLRKEGER